jgi:hypothetical protein
MKNKLEIAAFIVIGVAMFLAIITLSFLFREMRFWLNILN